MKVNFASLGIAALMTLALMASAPARGDGGKVVGTIRTLHLNVYGLPKNDCEERAQAIVNEIARAKPKYDIVSLNEHWTAPFKSLACDDTILTKGLEKQGMSGAIMLPAPQDFYQTRGGQSLFTPHAITETYEEPFVNSRDIPLYGPVLNRVKVSKDVSIDVWTVHMQANVDGCDRECRWEGLSDLASVIEIMNSGDHNPILVLGDFNIGGPLSKADAEARSKNEHDGAFPGNCGYYDIMDEFGQPLDVWLELHPHLDAANPPYTIDPDTNAIEKANKGKTRERIDYVFLAGNKLRKRSRYKLVPKSIELVRWKTAKGVPVSDHHGLDTTFDVVEVPFDEIAPEPKPVKRVKTKREKAFDEYWKRKNRENRRKGDWRK